jgi:hypothetical protein
MIIPECDILHNHVPLSGWLFKGFHAIAIMGQDVGIEL